MEIVEIVGVRSVNFQDDNGRQVEGLSFYYLMDGTNMKGRMSGKLFLSVARVQHLDFVPDVGDVVKVFYDRYGRPVDFAAVA